jgi:hypothetical protein
MTDLDTLFATTFPGTNTHQNPSISRRAVESNDKTPFIVDEGFLEAFYRGDFIYCVRNHLNYDQKPRHTITSISYCLPPFEIVRCVESSHRLDLLCKGSDWWAVINIGDHWIDGEFGVSSLARGRELAERFDKGLAKVDPPDSTVDYEVWSGEDYPSLQSFNDVKWPSIEQNYPQYTRKSIDELTSFSRKKSSSDGRIILFHGPPGTGKTYAIRSLLTHWKPWVTPALVLDPEHLLGSPSYMMNIMNRTSAEPTRLLVVEDADEIVASGLPFLGSESTSHASGISRLLNAADGIFGASNDVMFLLSTNVKPKYLDPALTRPGRCLATVEFGAFSLREATERLGAHGPATIELTLAEIYRKLGETTMLSNERPEQETSFGVYL